jgi:hypothetical protein
MRFSGRGKEMYTKLWYENFKERDHLEDLSMNDRMVLKFILKKWYR